MPRLTVLLRPPAIRLPAALNGKTIISIVLNGKVMAKSAYKVEDGRCLSFVHHRINFAKDEIMINAAGHDSESSYWLDRDGWHGIERTG